MSAAGTRPIIWPNAGDSVDGLPPGVDAGDRPLAINLRDECALGSHERVLEVVAADPAERDGSRKRWSAYKRLGYELNKHDM